MIQPNIHRLAPDTTKATAWPIWRRHGIRTLEAQLQRHSAQPLMDLAGLACARLALALAPHARRVLVLAGPGNNGGDGLEAALHLHRWGMAVQVHLLGCADRLPTDAQRAHQRAIQAGVCIQAGLANWPDGLGPQDLCIDALLGIGASRPPEGELQQAITLLNATSATVLALDLPTGLDADSGQALGDASAVVQANHTLTLIGAKPGLFMAHGRDACGSIWLDTLGLSDQAATGSPPDAELNQPSHPMSYLHASHKGSHGDVAIVGGESHAGETGDSMAGAAVLAASSALHGGAGRVILSLLGRQSPSLPPDVMRREWSSLDLEGLTVVAGCGGGQAIAAPLGRLLQRSARLVLDADALNRLAEDPWLKTLLVQRAQGPQTSVLTPHPLEAARLLGCSTAEVQADRLQAAEQLAHSLNCCVVLKGSGTVIAAPHHPTRINPTGNGLLATGGTGDVLAGLLGARLARQGKAADAWSAACDAAWTHGQTADAWPPTLALTASRLADRLQ